MHDFLFLKLDKKFLKLCYSEIAYAEAEKKYVRIVTPRKTFLVLSSITSVEKILPGDQFCRIHRSYIISLQHMTGFDNEVAYIGDKIFPIGKQHRQVLQDKVIILSNDKIEMDDSNIKIAG